MLILVGRVVGHDLRMQEIDVRLNTFLLEMFRSEVEVKCGEFDIVYETSVCFFF